MLKQSTVLTLGAAVLIGCGSGEEADPPESSPETAPEADAAAPVDAAASADADADAPAAIPAGAPAAMPADWIAVDEAARTVTVALVAGETDANNRWNFNGHANGEATVVVPLGYTVTVNFENRDPAHRHGAGVLARMASYPPYFDEATPVFDGAITASATSMTDATAPGGGSESITFVASRAGEYALVCPVPANAVTGMWIGFEVSGTGESGVRR